MAHFAVGIDLGGTNLKGALVDRSRGIVHQEQIATPAELGPEAVVARIADLARDLASRASDPVVGIGIGSPGAINWERTTVTRPPNFPGWDTVNVAQAIRLQFGRADLPVLVENDANVAGLGSAHYGAGQPFDSFVMVTLGTGVGGSIIYENRIFRGSTGGAGEIGHMTIDYEGPMALSGVPGAIEAYLGQNFLSDYARLYLRNRRDSLVHKMTAPNLTDISPRILHKAAVEGDEAAVEILAWAGHKLGCLMGSVVNLLDIRKFVVGGGVSGAGDYILDTTRKTLPQYVMPALHHGLEIVQETRGNDVALAGAAHLVFQEIGI